MNSSSFIEVLKDIIWPPCFSVLALSFIFAFIMVHFLSKLMCSNSSSSTTYNTKYEFNYISGLMAKYWKCKYPDASGEYQSPINIATADAICHRLKEPLHWNHFEETPIEMHIVNTGHTVELTAKYPCNIPTLNGADLLQCYTFANLCFRFSYLDDEGSEHTIDNRKYPLEMQCRHLSRDSMLNLTSHSDMGVLMLSYFYCITKHDNPFLDPIILNLSKIKKPFTVAKIDPFPLSWLCLPFRSNFYSYGGSLTQPPCTEGVTWFLYLEPLAISIKQLAEFRSLISENNQSRILKNSRPVQLLNNREVWCNYYSYD